MSLEDDYTVFKPINLRIKLSKLVDMCNDDRIKHNELLKMELEHLPIYLSDMEFNWLEKGPLTNEDVINAIDQKLRWMCTLFLKDLKSKQKAFVSYLTFGKLNILEGGILNLGNYNFYRYVQPLCEGNFDYERVTSIYLHNNDIQDSKSLEKIYEVVSRCNNCHGLFLNRNKIGYNNQITETEREYISTILFNFLDLPQILLLDIRSNGCVSHLFVNSFFSKLEIKHVRKLIFIEGLDKQQWEALFSSHPNKDEIIDHIRLTHNHFK